MAAYDGLTWKEREVALEPLFDALCVTVSATRAYLGATSDWIPRLVSPFYFRVTH